MGGKRKTLQFEEFAAHLDAIFDQVEAHGEEITVERGGKLFALRPKRRRRPRKSGRITADDPLWGIVGIGRSHGPTDVSSNKYKYVADAIASHFEQWREGKQQPQSPDESTDVPAPTAPTSPDTP
jgi:hypothetical protein